MDVAYLHLVTNHIPIIGIPFCLAILAVGIWRNSDEIKALSFLAFVVVGLATIGVYFLGQGGEDFVEELAGVSHDAIEDHEEFATFGLASALVTAALSLFALVWYKGWRLLGPRFRKAAPEDVNAADVQPHNPGVFPTWVAFLVLVFALVSSGVLGYTARLGGKIRHPEFHGGVQTTGQSNETNDADDENEEDEKGRGRGRNRGGQ